MKIIEINKLSKVLKTNKYNKKKIVLCHGTFDLMHIGHIKYFQEAKKYGEVLIVTITPDRFINKGPGRPIFNEDLRLESISALEVVDFVALNNWTTAIETIELLRPCVYAKGPDYENYSKDLTGNITLEANAIKSIGGVIKITKTEAFSSSSMINKYYKSLNQQQKEYVKILKSKFSLNKIIDYFDKIKSLKVAAIGEAIIDEYVFCDTIGKSGKEPVLVNKRIDSKIYAGGILSVSNNLSRFCESVEVFSYVGENNSYRDFIKDSMNVNVKLNLINKKKSPTIIKRRYIDSYTNTKTMGVYDLNESDLVLEDEKSLLKKLEKIIPNSNLVVLVDYDHGLVTKNILRYIEKNALCLALNAQINSSNIGMHTLEKYNKADFLCINESEIRHHFRLRDENLVVLAKRINHELKLKNVIITSGKGGSNSLNGNDLINCPAFANKVKDRVGAGDTLLAVSSLCNYIKMPIELNLFVSNLAAGIMVETIGTSNDDISFQAIIKNIETLYK